MSNSTTGSIGLSAVSSLDQSWQHLLKNSLANNTQKTYSSAQKRFLKFCEEHDFLHPNGSAVPASELTILRFIGSLSGFCQASTIRVYLSAVRSLHIQNGLEDPLVGCLRIPLVLRGLRRLKSSNRPQKIPITPLVLCSIKSQLNLDNYDDSMFWAACCMAFFGFLRAAELTVSSEAVKLDRYLSIKDLSIDKHPYPETTVLKLRYSKTDQFGKGCVIPLARSGSQICPVDALMSYLWLRGSNNGPLFLFEDRKPLSKDRLNNRLQKELKVSGFEGHFTLHSFRVGAATTAAALGFPDHLIQAMGRWSSDAYKIYIKLPVDRLISASRCMGSAKSFKE